MSVFICDKDMLAVLDWTLLDLTGFLTGFYLSNKVNFQNYLVNKLILYVFEAVRHIKIKIYILNLY